MCCGSNNISISEIIKSLVRGARGEQGIQGVQGPPGVGIQGEQGEQGERGPQGASSAIVVATRQAAPIANSFDEGQLMYITDIDTWYRRQTSGNTIQWVRVSSDPWRLVQTNIVPLIQFLNLSNAVVSGVVIEAFATALRYKVDNGTLFVRLQITWSEAPAFRKIRLRLDSLADFANLDITSGANQDAKMVPVAVNDNPVGDTVYALLSYDGLVANQTLIEFGKAANWGASQGDANTVIVTFALESSPPSTI